LNKEEIYLDNFHGFSDCIKKRINSNDLKDVYQIIWFGFKPTKYINPYYFNLYLFADYAKENVTNINEKIRQIETTPSEMYYFNLWFESQINDNNLITDKLDFIEFMIKKFTYEKTNFKQYKPVGLNVKNIVPDGIMEKVKNQSYPIENLKIMQWYKDNIKQTNFDFSQVQLIEIIDFLFLKNEISKKNRAFDVCEKYFTFNWKKFESREIAKRAGQIKYPENYEFNERQTHFANILKEYMIK
jgi:hypothetical protein